mmetsp:Transcript_37867/g.69002  ORF Transcript_37867/g.69002 Transcript_37867/m.69002 type:complete len:201 (-) Transcript_37867:57-659(-)
MAEEEVKPEVAEEEKPKEEPEEKKPVEFEGGAKGKYNWDDSAKSAAISLGAKISDYGWSDGKKRVSVYVELPDLDSLAEDKLVVDFDAEKPRKVTFTATFPSGARVLTLDGLKADAKSVTMERKMGQNKVVLKLFKKDDEINTWYTLLESSGGGGAADDDDGGMGGMGGMGDMGGMGGMDPAMMQQMMAGMGGGMGGMGM